MWLDNDKGNRLPAFHIRKGHPLTILVSHANAEDLGIVLGFWSYMSDALQVDVFAYEYSGYGHSTGTPSEDNMYSDARAALQLLVDGFKLKPERDIVLYGKSIGTCPTSYLAGRHRFRGVMLVSGLASGSRVLFPTTKLYPLDILYFNNIGRLAASKSPHQINHGTQDEVIPLSNGHDLHAAASKYHPLPVSQASACRPPARPGSRGVLTAAFCSSVLCVRSPPGLTARRTTTSRLYIRSRTCEPSAPFSSTCSRRSRTARRPSSRAGLTGSRAPSSPRRRRALNPTQRNSPGPLCGGGGDAALRTVRRFHNPNRGDSRREKYAVAVHEQATMIYP